MNNPCQQGYRCVWLKTVQPGLATCDMPNGCAVRRDGMTYIDTVTMIKTQVQMKHRMQVCDENGSPHLCTARDVLTGQYTAGSVNQYV